MVESHAYRATYRPDVSLGLAWGFRSSDRLEFDWAKFPDRICYATIADLVWNGSLVYRYDGVVVDGGRSTLPLPTTKFDTTDIVNPVVLEEQVTDEQVDFWRLIATLKDKERDFEHYLDTGTPPASLWGTTADHEGAYSWGNAGLLRHAGASPSDSASDSPAEPMGRPHEDVGETGRGDSQ
jgi:hypothetical protein